MDTQADTIQQRWLSLLQVWGAGFAEESEGDDDGGKGGPFFTFGSSATSDFSYLWSEPMTNDFSYEMDDGMTQEFSMLF